MKRIIIIFISLIFVCGQSYAHSGRTDSRGGHNCSQKSKNKGLCTGYHYHNKSSMSIEERVDYYDSRAVKLNHPETKPS